MREAETSFFKNDKMDETLVMRYQLRLLAIEARIAWLSPMGHADSVRLLKQLKLSK